MAAVIPLCVPMACLDQQNAAEELTCEPVLRSFEGFGFVVLGPSHQPRLSHWRHVAQLTVTTDLWKCQRMTAAS